MYRAEKSSATKQKEVKILKKIKLPNWRRWQKVPRANKIRIGAGLILAFFSFNLSSPTALAIWKIQTAHAQVDFGGAVSSAITSVFGKSGEILEKFDNKSAALSSMVSSKGKAQFDLVAILVDEELAKNNQNYEGLMSSYSSALTDKTLIARVERYAKDVQGINAVVDAQPYVKTAIIKVKRNQKTEEIAQTLERLYREGDGTLTESNKLKGVVIVGQVPLPVVNKNGNRFVSLFPYTDFDDPYYIYDEDSKDFIVNPANQKPGAEVWHGVIVPPAEGEEGNKLLAEYFDKNHLYKIGQPGFADFAKKIFYSDLKKEFDLVGEEGLPGYFKYLKYWEDISYFRFNKTWAQKLFANSPIGKPEGDGIDNDGDGKKDEDPTNGYDDDGDGEKGSPLFGLINSIDDDGDGEVDNDEEGVWGICSSVPTKGKAKLENCQVPGKQYKTGNFYNTKAGSKYFVADDINNDGENNQLIDEGIDEDEGDAFIGVDNDRDGRVDEDTSQDNDADGDKKSDEDDAGDMNKDGCPGQCDVDEDNDSVDADMDNYPDGYETEKGSWIMGVTSYTDPQSFYDFPLFVFLTPIGVPIVVPRISPWPSADDWIDEGDIADDDEDGKVDEDGILDNDNDQDGNTDEDPGDSLGNSKKGDGGGIFENLADIRTKDVIMGLFKKYNELFDKFYADVNVWVDATGRYDTGYKAPDGSNLTDLVTFPFLIAAKDEFTRLYFKAVNDSLERRVDKYVERLQYDIDLVKGSSLSGYIVLPDDNGVFPANSKLRFNTISFINFGYRNDIFFANLESFLASIAGLDAALVEPIRETLLKSIYGPVTSSTPIYINGKSIDSLTNIEQCSLYRGSEGDENSQMIIASTLYDPSANLNKDVPPKMPAEWASYPDSVLNGTADDGSDGKYYWWNNSGDSPMVKWLANQRVLNKAFAGCFSENANQPSRCFPALATRYIFSLGGGKQVKGIPNNAVSHQACFDFKEKNGYDNFSVAAYEYLKQLAATPIESEKAKLDPIKPSVGSIYRAPKDVKLLEFQDNPPTKYDDNSAIPIGLILSAATSAKLENFSVNLESVLKKYLGGDRIDNNANGVIDDAAEANTQFFAINPDGQPNWNQVGEQLLQKARLIEGDPDPKSNPLKFGPDIIEGTKEVYIKVSPISGKKISSLVYHKEPTVDTIEAQTYELVRDAEGNFIEVPTAEYLTDSKGNILKDADGNYVQDPLEIAKILSLPLEQQNLLKQYLQWNYHTNPDGTKTKTTIILPTGRDVKVGGKYLAMSKVDPDGNIKKTETRTAPSTPIDSPRYVTFRDSKGNYQKIIYPNVFRAKDMAEFKKQLKDLEIKLKTIALNPAYSGEALDINGYLTSIIESSLTNDVPVYYVKNYPEISLIAENKLADAFKWKSLDIDEKHQYALDKYWSMVASPFTPITESPEGYEVLYLQSEGKADRLSMKFNKDIPPPKGKDKVEDVDCSNPANASKVACADGDTEPSVSEAEASGAGGSKGDGGVIIFEWFQKLQEWGQETKDIISGKGAITYCPAGGFTDLPGDTGLVTEPYLPPVVVDIPVDLDGNGISDQAEKTVYLSIKFAPDAKNVLRAGQNDQTKVIVQAIDAAGKVNTADSVNQVKLTIKNVSGDGTLAEVIGPDTAQMAAGGSTFVIKSGDNSGTAALQAQLVANTKVKSEVLPLKISNEVIKLISYRRYSNYKFAEGGAAGYTIFDGNHNPIAEVDPLTGQFKLLSNKYQLQALVASGIKPLREAVVEKTTKKVLAILYFVVVGDKAINIDAPGTDYSTKYKELNGVHIKDLSASDNLSIQSVNDEELLKGNLQIIDSKVSENKGRVGLVDKRGNVFTNLKMSIKAGPDNGPVIYIIESSSGKPAFELFVGAKYQLITQLPLEQLKDLMAQVQTSLLAYLPESLIKLAHAQTTEAKTVEKPKTQIPDTDGDGLNDLEEYIIGTKQNNVDTNGDGINDLDSLSKGLDPRLTGGKTLFQDIQPGQEGFAEVVKLYRRGLFVADTSGKVRPKDKITREEFIKLDLGGICVICDRFSEKVKSSVWTVYSQNPFPDTDIATDYKYCVAEGKNRSIISGYKAFQNIGYYVPKANISRAEATKVILETARQQIESFPEFVANENLAGKPWYYNYVLTAQKEGIYPKGKFPALDKLNSEQFKNYFDGEIIQANMGLPGGVANSQLILWMEQPISRVEFAIMVSRFTDKYNCLANDSDGDGLPDNFEKYIYGTSSGNADTDKGGVNDDQEILNGTDPLNGKDDIAVNEKPVEPVITIPGFDPNADPDNDGLNNGKESEIGTDINDEDTDKGGVKDGTEVLTGTDPLNAGDDKSLGQGSGLESKDKDGAYLAGVEIGPKTIYSLPEDGSVDDTQINTEETDRVEADGKSSIYIRAAIYNENGEVDTDDNLSVIRFGFKNEEEDGLKASLYPPNVQVKKGIAETVLTAKTESGLPIVIASVEGKNVPSDEKLIEVYPGDPIKAEIKAVSPIIPSGGKSNTVIKTILRDQYNNIASAGNYTTTFSIDSENSGGARLDEKQDEDQNIEGIQLSSVTGEYALKLISGENPENLKVKLSYQSDAGATSSEDTTKDLIGSDSQPFKAAEVTGETTVAIKNDLQLILDSNKTELKTDGKEIADLEIKMADGSGNVLTGYEGEINLKLLNDKMGKLIDNDKESTSLTKTFVNGVAKFKVRSTFKAGDLVLLANTAGLPTASLKIENYAYKASRIVFETKDSEVSADPSKTYQIKAKLYDSAGNLVTRDNTTELNFSVDEESTKFASIITAKKVKVANGEAEFSIQTGTLTGPIRLRAKGTGLADGAIEITAVKTFLGKDFRTIQPKFLYGSLLGAAYGEVTQKDYFGGWFIFSGKVESAVSLITDPKPKLRLAEIYTSGRVNLTGSGDLEVRLQSTGAENSPVKQIVSDMAEGKEVMEVSFIPKPQTQVKLVNSIEEINKQVESVNVENLVTDNEQYLFENDTEAVNILRDGQLIASIGRNAKIKLLNPTADLIVNDEDNGREINWKITDLGNDIAEVVIVLGDLGDVKIIESGTPTVPGVFVKKLATLPQRSLIQSYSGNSTASARGYYYTDDSQELSKDQAPGLSYLSLESAGKEEGVGLRGENKNLLLFAAGNSVGESNLNYASDAGVVLGDPTVRVDNRKVKDQDGLWQKLYSATGYTKDLGKMILAGNKNIKEIVTIDYDNDGDRDALVSYEDGQVRLLENINGGKGFEDKGIFLNFPTGILSQAVLDINNDGWEDLVIAAADSCKIGEVCVDAYLNNKGNFVRKNLNLEGYSAKNKVYMMRAADMNQDSYADLVVSDDTGSVKVFYVHQGQINKEGSLIGNLGVKINQTDNLKEEVFAYYNGMIGNQPELTDNKNFETVVLRGKDSEADKTYELKSIAADGILGVSSTKNAKDLTEPLNVLAEGDQLEYQVKVNNSSSTTLNNFLLADIVPENVSLDVSSVKCLDCKGAIQLAETGQSLRPYVIVGIDMPAKTTRTITYKVTVGKLPKVKITVGQNLSSDYPVKDGYPDVAATPEGNPTGRMVYYYSISKDNSTGKITYGKYVTPPPSSSDGYTQPKDADGKAVGLDLNLFDQKGPDGLPVAVKHFMDYGTFPGMDKGGAGGGKDSISSLPGVGGAYDDLGSSLDSAADDLEGAISALTCSGGCIPMPINFAFLAPGPINVMGIPSGFDPGLPIFAWGVPSIVPFWPPSPYQGSLGGRIYLSPTLTGKLAMATCLGPYLIGFGPVPGNCFTVVLPVDPLAGLCDQIAGAVEGTLSKANETISDGSGTIGSSSDGSLANSPTADGKNYTGGFQASSSLGNYRVGVNTSTNIRIPSFPSVLTNWLDNQSSEIINKLTDLPDIYILLPDLGAAFNSVGDTGKALKDDAKGDVRVKNEPVTQKGLRGVLNKLNQIPLITIEPQEVLIKIPSLTPAEIDRFINDSKQWVEDEYDELQRVIGIWKCGPFKEMVPDPNDPSKQVPGYIEKNAFGKDEVVYGERPYMKFCDIFTADMTKLIKSVEKNIEIVEGYKKLPRQILAWRNMLTKYVVQIICYIDAIVQFFVGNIAKWLDQAFGWVDAVATIRETIETWKLMFDLVIEYQTSCDKCTSSRFSLLELVLKLFVFIPSPPIIPFPKLPDIYLDFSQIQLGVKVLWPDIKFRPEKIVLPRLPRIVLPNLPKVRIELPSIPLLPDLSLSLPELPDLPPLTLPALPNLPPPPKIPALPGGIKATISILKKIFKILCLIKKGFIPTNEAVLKTTIEHMTERGLDPLLPFDLGLAVQLPQISYDYVDRVVLTVKVNLNNALEFNTIYEFVKGVADKINSVSTNFSEAANNFSKSLENTAAASAEGVNNDLNNAVPSGNTDKTLLNMLPGSVSQELYNQLALDPELSKDFAIFSPELADAINGLATASKDMAGEAERFKQLAETDFQDIHLIAGTVTMKPSDAAANKTIEELDKFDYNSTLLALGDGFKETKKLAGLRQNLLAYVKENQKINDNAFQTNNLEEFATLMAQAPMASDILVKSGYNSNSTMLAAQKKLYAALPSLSDIIKNSGLSGSVQGKPVTKGMYIYNEALKQNEKIIQYEEELSLPTTMNFIDSDNDSDNDLIYSFGTNVYFKENYKVNSFKGKFYGAMPKFYDLDEFIPAAGSVSGLSAIFSGNKTLDLQWNKSNRPNLTGYELIVGNKLGGVSYKGVVNDLKADGMSKFVFLNSADQTGAALTNSILVPQDNAYNFPTSTLYELMAAEVTGDVSYTGPEQKVLVSGADRFKLAGDQQIYAGNDTVLKVWLDGEEKDKKKMQARELITMPSGFGGNLEIQVESGTVTIIDPTKIIENQKLLPGSKVELKTKYQSIGSGNALIKLPKEAYTRVDAGQSMQIEILEDADTPSATLSLPNGFYYSVIRSFDQTGFRSLRSESTTLSPNICSDRQVPLPIAGPSERTVAIFKTLPIDASKSFDAFGKITSYYVDTDLDYDSNNDGDKTNDRNLGRDSNPAVDSDGNGVAYDDLDDPTFYVGPYKDLNTRKVMLNVVDESGNIGQQEFTISVYVPKIFLDDSSANLAVTTTGDGMTVSGSTEPEESEMPISIIRDRDGVKDILKSKSADANGKYFTDAKGKFAITDLQLKDTVVIRNEKGEIIAEIDPKTGRIILKNPLYSVEALPAEEPILPTRVVVKDPKGKIIATLFIVADANTDVVIDGPEIAYTAASVGLFKGVHIRNLLVGTDDLEIKKIPGDAEKFAGGIEIVEKASKKRLAVLDPGGNFYINDPRIKLGLKSAADLKEPMIFQVTLQKSDGTKAVIAEFNVAFSTKNPITILDPNKFKIFVGKQDLKGPKFDTDKDGIADQWEQQFGLNIDNPEDAKEDPDKDSLNNLDEYLAGTNPLLSDSDDDGYDDGFEKVFGKDPNTKATSPFADVNEKNPDYQSILNYFQRGILAGIPSGNQLNFGFDQPIQRAEYAKVMLDTFCIVPRPEAYQGPGVFTDISFTADKTPWYYAATKEAYFQGFITGYRGQIDKVTGMTPFAPEASLSKAEGVKVILEALERQGIISLENVPIVEPYYLPYMQIAQDLTPYVKSGITLKNNSILTAEEAKNPEADLNRGEFIKLADRVLSAYDCSLIDTDGDGMPDFWENQNGLDPLNAGDADNDPDKDGLVNLDEYKYGTKPQIADSDGGGIGDGEEVLKRQTNPLDGKDDYLDSDGDGLSDTDEINKYKTKPGEKDSDGGGVSDGDEVLKNGTNPNNPLDDKDTDGDGLGDKEEQSIYMTKYLDPDTDGGGIKDGAEVARGTNPLDKDDDLIDPRKDLMEGAYVIPEPCSACPCPSAIDHTADLIPGDRIIGVISNNKNTEIFSQSNLVTIEDVAMPE